MHSILSPSSAHRWINCPGSVKLESSYPEEKNIYSEEGIKAHKYCHDYLTGQTITAVSSEMKKACDVYIKYIKTFKSSAYEWISFEESYAQKLIHPVMFGTPDCVIAQSLQDIHVIDFKYGMGVVEAENNEQLLCYAAGVYEFLGRPENCRFYLTIVQPRAPHKNGSVRIWEITSETLKTFIENAKASAHLALSSSATLKAGNHCQYCKAKKDCSAFKNKAYEASIVTPEFESLSHELQYFKTSKKIIESRIDDLTKQIIALLKNNTKVPLYELKQSMSRRKWSMDASEIFLIGEEYGIDLSAPVSPAEAERLGMPYEIVNEMTIREKSEYRLEEI